VEPLLAIDARGGLWIDRSCSAPERGPHQVRDLLAIRDSAEAGLAVAVLPRVVGDPRVVAGRLRVVLKRWATPEVPVNAVFASARFLAPKVRALVELASAALGERGG
jgi:DNA-binding transcriptional LysR family regulator